MYCPLCFYTLDAKDVSVSGFRCPSGRKQLRVRSSRVLPLVRMAGFLAVMVGVFGLVWGQKPIEKTAATSALGTGLVELLLRRKPKQEDIEPADPLVRIEPTI